MKWTELFHQDRHAQVKSTGRSIAKDSGLGGGVSDQFVKRVTVLAAI